MAKERKNEKTDVVAAGEAPIEKKARSATTKDPVEKKARSATTKAPVDRKARSATSKAPVGQVVDAATEAGADSLMVDVVFRLPSHSDAREVVLVGDFNGWSQAAHMMTRQGDGFEITVPLQRDHRYRYRYLIDGHRWENDWNADEYVPNDYGGDDSVRIV